MRLHHVVLAGLAALGVGSAAHAATFPPYGADPSANIVITYNPNGSITTVNNGYPPYDNIEDSYIGIVNNSHSTVNSLNLSSSQNIGGFDGDGIDTYGAPGNSMDTTGYGGPQTYFTNNTGTSLTANFIGGIAPNGGSTYFSLEEAVNVTQLAVPEPTTWALMLLGVCMLGVGLRTSRRHGLASA